ncbi:MAG: glycosyltransferase family 1 protein [Microthrixaceae bacterium]
MTSPRQVLIEVTDTISIGYTTGIQRVVREIIKGLQGPAGEGLEIVPVLKPSVKGEYRRLTEDELSQLEVHPPGGRAGRRADNFGSLSPIVRVLGDLKFVIWTRVQVSKFLRKRRELHPVNVELALGTPEIGAIFLDLEGSWYDPEPRSTLLPCLHAKGVSSMVLIHDVMPIVHPEWFDPRHIAVFESWIQAHVQWSSRFLANSECTAKDLRAVAEKFGRADEVDVIVIPLGADYQATEPTAVELPAQIGRFLLVVGTLEPRKNQTIVLDAFDQLSTEFEDLSLILVGKEGWMVDSLVSRIRSHPDFERRVCWFGGIEDSELSWLYENAFLSVNPSFYEGLGVPVLEALAHGCATVASTGGALPEAGAGFTELIEPDDVDGLVRLIRLHLESPEHHQAMKDKAAMYRPPSWSETADIVAQAVRTLPLTAYRPSQVEQ